MTSGHQTTSDFWTYREAATLGTDVRNGVDLVGFSVEARDGKIGKVEVATYAASRSYIVVDTGPWIFGKRVMLPAGVIERIDLDSETIFVDRTKDESSRAWRERYEDARLISPAASARHNLTRDHTGTPRVA